MAATGWKDPRTKEVLVHAITKNDGRVHLQRAATRSLKSAADKGIE